MAINDPEDLAAIRDIEKRLQPTISIGEVVNVYAADALVLDHSAPGHYRGRSEIFDNFSKHLSPVAAMTAYFNECTIVSDGEIAAALMQISFTAIMHDGTTLNAGTRNLDALAKIDGQWQIVQQHIALPLSPEGYGLRNAIVPFDSPLPCHWAPQLDRGVDSDQAERELASWTEQSNSAVIPAEQAELYAPASRLYDFTFPGRVDGDRDIGARAAAFNETAPLLENGSVQIERYTNGRFAVQLCTRPVQAAGPLVRPAILRQSNCLVRSGGRWRSVFEMRSFLMDRVDCRPVPAPAGALYPERAL
jgi:ketosteroid isomerase-like protein